MCLFPYHCPCVPSSFWQLSSHSLILPWSKIYIEGLKCGLPQHLTCRYLPLIGCEAFCFWRMKATVHIFIFYQNKCMPKFLKWKIPGSWSLMLSCGFQEYLHPALLAIPRYLTISLKIWTEPPASILVSRSGTKSLLYCRSACCQAPSEDAFECGPAQGRANSPFQGWGTKFLLPHKPAGQAVTSEVHAVLRHSHYPFGAKALNQACHIWESGDATCSQQHTVDITLSLQGHGISCQK